jgi:2-iminobutanoate/2-iminopropanoate deaminase|tara:strand:+ start:1844 stop:2227 length:384 start_codon:yes stop_codon:yes gene_type:complete
MKKRIISTLNAPSPIGPYNQAVMANDTLYISGQIPLKSENMELVQGDIKKETQQVMENLGYILDAAEMKFENVVKSTIFLSEMENFGQVNQIYSSYFENKSAPARETLAVKTLPKNVRIEISMIAVK